MTDKPVTSLYPMFTPCGECGMSVCVNEYHPYGACLMFKASKNSDVVRKNLSEIREHDKERHSHDFAD